MTIDVEYIGDHGTNFSVDFVPAVIFTEWPVPAKDWTSHWLPETVIAGFKGFGYHHGNRKPFLVPKVHPSGKRIYNVVTFVQYIDFISSIYNLAKRGGWSR